MFENAPMPYQSLDENGIIITVNNAWLDMLGYKKEEVKGTFIGNYLTESSLTKLQERFPLFKQQGWIKDADFEMVTKSGIHVLVIVNGKIQNNEQGHFRATHCILINTTDKQKARDALLASELRFKQIIQASPMGIHMYVLRENDRLLFTGANPAADKILGINHDQFIGKSIEEAFPGLIQTEIPDRYRDCARTGTAWHTEQIEYKEGSISGAFEVAAFQTEPGSMAALFNDITKRKEIYDELLKAKERAEESDRLKSAFLANLSHEIRTPMNAILGFTDLLGMSKLTEEQKECYIEIIKNSGTHLLSIINDIIEISQIETGQITVHSSPVNIDALIANVYQQLLVTIPENKPLELRINNIPQGDDSFVITDEVKLQEILVNLVTNAIKYTENGFVSLGYHFNNPDEIEFTIRDTGIGIDKKYHQLIFERFSRVEGEMAIKQGGSGLGLAITKAYVTMLGGEIKVQSELGQGSIFTFSIPVTQFTSENTRVKSTEKAKREQLGGYGQILIAEDDEFSFLYLKSLLTDTHYQLLRATNGQEAIEICEKNPKISLVLMDIKMPVLDGLNAARQIKEENPSLHLVAQTAYALEADRKLIEQAGFSGYLTKPIEKEKLMDIIEALVGE